MKKVAESTVEAKARGISVIEGRIIELGFVSTL